ncbi:S4 domain-containing protein, partial [Paraclostridium bifermentans]
MAKKQRLDKVLSNLGYGSRAEIKRDCKNGLVKVNGKIENNPGLQVDTDKDIINFDGETI